MQKLGDLHDIRSLQVCNVQLDSMAEKLFESKVVDGLPDELVKEWKLKIVELSKASCAVLSHVDESLRFISQIENKEFELKSNGYREVVEEGMTEYRIRWQ